MTIDQHFYHNNIKKFKFLTHTLQNQNTPLQSYRLVNNKTYI